MTVTTYDYEAAFKALLFEQQAIKALKIKNREKYFPTKASIDVSVPAVIRAGVPKPERTQSHINVDVSIYTSEIDQEALDALRARLEKKITYRTKIS